MELSALIKAVLAPLEVQRAGDLLRDFHPGDKLTGRVLQVESDGRVLIDLGVSRVLAQIAFKVNPGQVLQLQVVETGPVLHLKTDALAGVPQVASLPVTDFSTALTEAEQQAFIQSAERLLASPHLQPHSAEVPRAVQNAISQVRALFDSIPLDKPVEQIAQWIQGALEDRGTLFEKRLADWVAKGEPISADSSMEGSRGQPAVVFARDIKAQLLILRNYLAENSDPRSDVLKLNPKTIASLQHSVDRLLGHVEQQQERAVARWQAGEAQQLLVQLLPMAQQQPPLQLKVYYAGKHVGQEGQASHHIALLLQLDRLGMVRVDLALIAEQLHIRFFVPSEAVKARLQEEIHLVEESLSASFQRVQVEIFVSQEKIAQFQKEDLKGAAAGRIDITA